MIDPREIKEKATQLFSKGKFGKAAEALEEYCKADPRDVQARLRMGDAWAKAGKKEKAVVAYTSAAEGFAKDGFLPRAIAASKLILELDPSHQGVQKMLADLYARKSFAARPGGLAQKPAPGIAMPEKQPSVAAAAVEISGEPSSPAGSDFSNRSDAIEIEGLTPPEQKTSLTAASKTSGEALELVTREGPAPAPARFAPPPPPPDAEAVASWELPPPIEIEIETEAAGSDGGAIEVDLSAPAAVEPEAPLITGEVEVAQGPQPTPSVAPDDETHGRGPSDLPPGLTPRQSSPQAARPPLAVAAPPFSAPQSASAATAKTELERSLEAFSKFDVDAPAEPSTPRAQVSPVASAKAFTELDFDGDSLLQAVEAAAGVPYASSPSLSMSQEEAMEALDEPKLEPGALPKIPLFSDLPADAFIALFEKCPLRRGEPGDLFIEQGSPGDSFFVICAGTARVFRHAEGTRRELATLPEGSFFGEMALLSDAPRSASVEAGSEDTQLLEIPGAVLADLSKNHPTIATALKKFCRQRLLANLMNQAMLFKPFTKTERRDLVQKFRARDVGRGEVLIREGERSDGLYVILTGEVLVQMKGTWVATLKEGEVFGEMSLLTRSNATATVTTSKKTSLLRLPREDFDALIMSHPQILEQVAELTDARTRKNAELTKSKASAQSIV